MPPLFFLSYAREDLTKDLRTFYGLLVEAVRLKFGGEGGNVGFFDTKSIELGTEWPGAMIDALQGCLVFLPLYSPSYFRKEYCGKEWGLFRARQDAYAAAEEIKRPSLVLPILWAAKEDLDGVIPTELLDVQFEDEEFGESYSRLGLAVLMRQRRYLNARHHAVEVIARRIKRAVVTYGHLPSLTTTPLVADVNALFPGRSAVRESSPGSVGPRFVQLIIVAGTKAEVTAARHRNNSNYYGADGHEWRPYRPIEERRAGSLANLVIAERDFLPEVVSAPLTDGLCDQVEAAQEQNKIVVLLVDTWTLHIERYQRLMARFDKGNYVNTAVLVLWDSDTETKVSEHELDELVRATFFHRCLNQQARLFISPVRSVDDFKRDLGEALEAALRRMREYGKLMRTVASRPKPTF